MPARRLPLDGPLDLVATLAPMRTGRHDPTLHLESTEAWRALRTVEGAATLRLRHGGGHVTATAWGPGSDAALALAPAMLGRSPIAAGATDPLDGAPHELVRRAARSDRGLRMGASGTVVATAIATVLGQRVTSGEAIRSWSGLVGTFGGPAPGPGADRGLRLPPDPGVLATTGYAALHRFGVERGRSSTIRTLCRHAARLESLVDTAPDAALRTLRLLPGVGAWTASIVATVALGHPDAPVVGDYHIPHHVGFALDGTVRSSDARMLELLAPYAGCRGRAQRLILRAGPRPPRRAPRQRVLPVARM